jgi:hypothetical protein
VKPMSNDWWYGSAYGLAVAGDSLLCAYSEGVAAIPTAGGKSQLTFATPVYAMAGDGDGYVVQESAAIIEHHHGSAPRVIGTSDMMTSFSGSGSMAVGGGYAYVFAYDSTKSPDPLVRAYPLDGGVEMLRYPIDGNITDVAVDGTSAVIGMEDNDGEHVVRVGAQGSKRLFHAQAYVDTVVAGDGEVAFGSNGEIYALAKGGQRARRLTTSDIGAQPLAVHKQLVYYAMYGSIFAVPVGGGAAVKVFDGTTMQDVGEYATISSIEFGNDHLYFAVTYGGTLGLYSIDEKRDVKLVWAYPVDESDGSGFFPDFAVIGATAYVHDYTHVWAIALDDGSSKVAWKHDDAQISWLDSVGPHLVAWTASPDGTELIEVMPKSGKTHVLWRSSLDGGYTSFMAAGDDAVYVVSPELYAILKIPVD